QGAEVFTGIIEEINIDSEYVIVRITSSETDEEIYTTISNALADYFELQNADSPANYMRFYLEAESDYRTTSITVYVTVETLEDGSTVTKITAE
ncbi:MAG: hypothetical protein IIY30_05080, partial [Erysipelotrichaceae bacterium]|nr:hypothetical protein [Erysipelotrichaceae bacterium]